jgi:DNA-binding CsgD family transcriptional regulator
MTARAIVSHEQALRSGDRRMTLKAHALSALAGVVPATLATFHPLTRRLEIDEVVGLYAGAPSVSLADEWHRYATEASELDPFAPQRVSATGCCVLTLADGGEAARPFAAWLERCGWRDRAMVYLREGGTIVAVVALLRSAELGPFSRAEVVALRRVQPLVEQAYACAAGAEHGDARAVLRARGLSRREADVAELVGEGATNAEIAHALHVGLPTVKTHLTRVYAKLRVETRTQLAILVRDRA